MYLEPSRSAGPPVLVGGGGVLLPRLPFNCCDMAAYQLAVSFSKSDTELCETEHRRFALEIPQDSTPSPSTYMTALPHKRGGKEPGGAFSYCYVVASSDVASGWNATFLDRLR
jgi:hypothetical protein